MVRSAANGKKKFGDDDQMVQDAVRPI
uniref:Calmodulin n=1 Tax=Acrobeloides nanus TaxID=290746 RepID=A0A914CHI7_9BILA